MAHAFHLAQLNVGRILHPLDHPAIRPFMDALDHINRLADNAPGFVWRLQTESGNATDVKHPWSADPFFLVNMSVWTTPQALRDFIYRSEHREYLARRGEFFEKMAQAHYVLWWIPAGHIPTLEEAAGRLEHYQRNGPTPYAFWFGNLFPAPEPPVAAAR
ncbi:MAG TPA: DUF3291 domain-containing protein [Bryobacteraceae bacterium]|nr:DUF3291 domain-containing protein [Bryobacteraceae bacterium]